MINLHGELTSLVVCVLQSYPSHVGRQNVAEDSGEVEGEKTGERYEVLGRDEEVRVDSINI